MASKGKQMAAKSQPAAPKKRAAPEEHPEASPTAKPQSKPCGDAQLKSQCRHYFGRLAAGEVKKASPEDVAQAQDALDTFDKLEEPDKIQFAKAFYSNKGTKTFGFIKDYSEKVLASKVVTQKLEENYMTRILVS